MNIQDALEARQNLIELVAYLADETATIPDDGYARQAQARVWLSQKEHNSTSDKLRTMLLLFSGLDDKVTIIFNSGSSPHHLIQVATGKVKVLQVGENTQARLAYIIWQMLYDPSLL